MATTPRSGCVLLNLLDVHYVENAPIGDVPLTLEAVKAFAEKCLKAEPPQVIIPYFAKRSK